MPSADKSSHLAGDVLPWLLMFVGLIVLGGLAIFVIRRRLEGASAMKTQGFTLQDLREMRDVGDLTAEEFERARAQMIGRVAQGKNLPPSASSPGNQQHGVK